jgi:hypothetical protein
MVAKRHGRHHHCHGDVHIWMEWLVHEQKAGDVKVNIDVDVVVMLIV